MASFIGRAPVSIILSIGGYTVKRCIVIVPMLDFFWVLVGVAVVGAAWALASLAGNSKTLSGSCNAHH